MLAVGVVHLCTLHSIVCWVVVRSSLAYFFFCVVLVCVCVCVCVCVYMYVYVTLTLMDIHVIVLQFHFSLFFNFTFYFFILALIVGSGIGSDVCMFLPEIVADPAAYISSSSWEPVSQTHVRLGLLPACLLDGGGSNGNATRKGMNLTFLNFVNVRSTSLPWSQNIKSNLSSLLQDLSTVEQAATPGCFWSSSTTEYARVNPKWPTFSLAPLVPGSKQYLDMNRTAPVDDSNFRQQDIHIKRTLTSIQSHLNMTRVAEKIDKLQDVMTSIVAMDKQVSYMQAFVRPTTDLIEKCGVVKNSLQKFKKVTCEKVRPMLLLMGLTLIILFVLALPIAVSILLIQRRWGAHGPIPVSHPMPSTQHRLKSSHFGHINDVHPPHPLEVMDKKEEKEVEDDEMVTSIEMKENPMGEKKRSSIVHDLHGPMKETSWM